jgi:hypothetical protein
MKTKSSYLVSVAIVLVVLCACAPRASRPTYTAELWEISFRGDCEATTTFYAVPEDGALLIDERSHVELEDRIAGPCEALLRFQGNIGGKTFSATGTGTVKSQDETSPFTITLYGTLSDEKTATGSWKTRTRSGEWSAKKLTDVRDYYNIKFEEPIQEIRIPISLKYKPVSLSYELTNRATERNKTNQFIYKGNTNVESLGNKLLVKFVISSMKVNYNEWRPNIPVAEFKHIMSTKGVVEEYEFSYPALEKLPNLDPKELSNLKETTKTSYSLKNEYVDKPVSTGDNIYASSLSSFLNNLIGNNTESLSDVKGKYQAVLIGSSYIDSTKVYFVDIDGDIELTIGNMRILFYGYTAIDSKTHWPIKSEIAFNGFVSESDIRQMQAYGSLSDDEARKLAQGVSQYMKYEAVISE